MRCATEKSSGSQPVLWRKDGVEAGPCAVLVGINLRSFSTAGLWRKDAPEAGPYAGIMTVAGAHSVFPRHTRSFASRLLFHSFCVTAFVSQLLFHSFFTRWGDFMVLPKNLFHRLSQLFPKIG